MLYIWFNGPQLLLFSPKLSSHLASSHCFHRPYVIDLESTNGTYVNNQRIEPARYYELKEKVRQIYKLGVAIVNNIHFCIKF